MKKNIAVWALALCSLPVVCFADLPVNYGEMNALQKQEVIWSNVTGSQYVPNSESALAFPTEESSIPSPELLSPFFLSQTFFHVSDEMPEGRVKTIHAYGSVAKVELRITNRKYSGVLRTGGIGVARLSIARMAGSQTNFIPGLAIKILIDHQPSINFHVMNSVDGQGSDRNYFSRVFSNILPDPTSLVGKLIDKSFETAVRLMNHYLADAGPVSAAELPLLQACQMETNGAGVRNVECPEQIIFTPAPEFRGLGLNDDFRKDLASIPSGAVLYKVSVKKTRDAAEEVVGELITQSPLVASSYGDAKLFFQHAIWSR
jgi:hypothetical protein